MFGTAKVAAEAYDLAAIQAKHSTSDLNFPDMIHLKKKIPKIMFQYGVSKEGKKFKAVIYFDGKQKHLGCFTRARDAAMAYDMAIVAGNRWS